MEVMVSAEPPSLLCMVWIRLRAMPVVSATSSRMRPLLASTGRRALKGRVMNPTFCVARRGSGILAAKTNKHLLSEFVAVRGPVVDEVRLSEDHPELALVLPFPSTGQFVFNLKMSQGGGVFSIR